MKRGAALYCTVFLVVLVGLVGLADDRIAHDAIEITHESEFNVLNGVCSGSGTAEDPFVIENWVIDAGYDEYGIRVHGTSAHVVIRNVEVSGASKSAIYLSYVENAVIEDCLLEGNWAGVTINFSSYNRVQGCAFESNTDAIRFYFSHTNLIRTSTFSRNDTAIWFDASNENAIQSNLIEDSHMGLYLNLGSEANTITGNAFVDNVHNAHTDDPNIWDNGESGNYWSDCVAVDMDGNLIWDVPYLITSDGDQDNYPLVTHPLVPQDASLTCDDVYTP